MDKNIDGIAGKACMPVAIIATREFDKAFAKRNEVQG